MKKAAKVKEITISECDESYKATRETYQRYLEQTVAKLGGPKKVATRIMRSRAHLFDCMSGRRRLDTVRSLAWLVAREAKEISGVSPFVADETL